MAKQTKVFKQELGDFKNVKPVLTPLHCFSCGTPVVLSENKVAICTSCGNENPIPDEYRELVASKKKHEQGLEQAKALLEKVSEPPNPLFLLWYNVSEIVFGTLGIILMIALYISGAAFFIALFMVYFIYYTIAPYIHINLIDVYGPGNVYALTFVALSVFLIFPLVLNAYVEDFVDLKKTLQASLSAHFPDSGKNDAKCRCCGASLELSPGAVCAVCSYCQAENILTLPEKWRKKLTGFANWHFKTIQEVFETESRFRKEIKENLRFWFYATIIAGGFFWLFGYFVSWVDNNPVSIPSWNSVSKNPREMVVTKDYESEGFPSIPYNTIVKSNGLSTNYWLAMDYNETFFFKSWDFPNDVAVFVFATTTFDEHKLSKELHWKSMPDSSWQISWKAPYKGLFNIYTKTYGKVEHPFTMKWWIENTDTK